MRAVLLALALVALGAPSATLGAEGDGSVARWEALRAEAVERLEALAAWALDAKLFSSRAETLETLLLFEPEHAAARKALHYKKDRQGWTRDPKYKPVKNQSALGKEYEARRTALGAWVVSQAGPAIEAARREAPRARSGWVASVLALAPDSAVARGWNDELLDPAASAAPRWILQETLAARARRPALKQTGAEAVKGAPVAKDGLPEDVDKPGGVTWPRIVQSPRVRVLGFPAAEELRETARHVEAAWPVYEAALGRTGVTLEEKLSYGRGLTLYVFDAPADAEPWLAAQPGVTERFAEFSKPLVGTFLPGRTAHCVKSVGPELRREAAPRQVVADLLRHGLGLHKRQAWLAEALIIYLTWQIVGTRHIYSVTDPPERYAQKQDGRPDPTARMSDASADWLELARELLEGPGTPDPYLLPGRDFNQITKPDVLYGYAVAAYAVEGLGERTWPFLAALAADRGTDLDAVCIEVLGHDMRTLEARVRRWLAETLPLTPR